MLNLIFIAPTSTCSEFAVSENPSISIENIVKDVTVGLKAAYQLKLDYVTEWR